MKPPKRYASGRFTRRALGVILGLGALKSSVASRQRAEDRRHPPQQTKSTTMGSKTPQDIPDPRAKSTDSLSAQRGASEPALVKVHGGTLTIKASNSDLSQILQDISHDTGMVIVGPVRDVRVYGNYGPQTPPDILTQLLAGLGYNIVMAGSAREGAPGRLILTSRGDDPSPPRPEQSSARPTPSVSKQSDEPVLGPGAIAHPPPEPSNDPQARVQQNLERLQKMHETQTNENVPR